VLKHNRPHVKNPFSTFTNSTRSHSPVSPVSVYDVFSNAVNDCLQGVNCGTTVNTNTDMMCKEADVKEFQILHWNLPIETEKHHEQTIRIYSFRTKI
jgi:hypothetical protein